MRGIWVLKNILTDTLLQGTTHGTGKSAETKDIERIVKNRMKSLKIEGECKLEIFFNMFLIF